ncbi:YkgJ family cysteine cluster protein [bacterium]|nr:YkgJ family cysteine cluster protein [bacterium]
MLCRPDCGACCIAPSISSSIPGMPGGKAAGERCINLNDNNACIIFDHPDRPRVCNSLRPSIEMCGSSAEMAMSYLTQLEWLTSTG